MVLLLEDVRSSGELISGVEARSTGDQSTPFQYQILCRLGSVLSNSHNIILFVNQHLRTSRHHEDRLRQTSGQAQYVSARLTQSVNDPPYPCLHFASAVVPGGPIVFAELDVLPSNLGNSRCTLYNHKIGGYPTHGIIII